MLTFIQGHDFLQQCMQRRFCAAHSSVLYMAPHNNIIEMIFFQNNLQSHMLHNMTATVAKMQAKNAFWVICQ